MLTINQEDTRRLIESVRSNYNLDLSEYGPNLLRYRISQYLSGHLIKDAENLINHLLEDEIYLDEFLSAISAGTYELFRDPGMWQYLRLQILPQLFSVFNEPVFWLPRSVSGHDAFSLVILLAEEDCLNKCKICSSTSNFADLNRILAGKLENQFMNLSRDNYLNSGGKKSLEAFLDSGRDQVRPGLIRKIKLARHINMLHDVPGQVHLIMIRNQLLNFTSQVKNHILNHLTGILPTAGILVLGAKELIGDDMISRKYEPLLMDEGIYRKKE